MPSIFKYRNGYRAQATIGDKRISKAFRTRREAVAWGSATESEHQVRQAASPGELHTLADAMRKYAKEVSPTKQGARWEELRIAAMIRLADLPVNSKLAAITPDHIGQWRNLRLTQVGPGTVLREIGLLSAVLETARREWRWITVNPIADVRKPRMPDHREVLITRPQIKAMLRVMGYSPARPIRTVAQACSVAFLIALRTGMRAGELCGVKWSDVYEGYCKVNGKTGKRDVPLTAKAQRLIEAMRGYDPVFVVGVTSQSLDAMFRKYRKRAGLSGFTFHDARHVAATWMAKKVHVLELCRAFGWKNTGRALTYFNSSAADIAKRLG